MSGHTPGPWEITGNPLGDVAIPIAAPRSRAGGEIGIVAAAMGGKSSSDANARLIAAAPDLLAALEEIKAYCVQYGEGWSVPHDIALLAIAKAEGRS